MEIEKIAFGDMLMEPYLKEAMKQVCREGHIYNDSITWQEEDGGLVIIIKPTYAHFLYNLFFRMGVLYKKKNPKFMED